MEIILADHAGACYGVQRAIDMARDALKATNFGQGEGEGEASTPPSALRAACPGKPGRGANGQHARQIRFDKSPVVSTLGPLIHNPAVVSQLSRDGLARIDDASQACAGDTVVIRSHGVTPAVMRELCGRGCNVVDATCPHVLRAARGAAALARTCSDVLVVGESGHPEVEGIVAHAKEAGARTYVISCEQDVYDYLDSNRDNSSQKTATAANAPGDEYFSQSGNYTSTPDARETQNKANRTAAPIRDTPPDAHARNVGVVVQTTQRREFLDEVLDSLRASGINPQVKDTICSATTERQNSAAALSAKVDAMVVIGGRNSSNTTRLAEICAKNCPTFHIETPGELDKIDVRNFEKIGITAGASTPESQINDVIDYLKQRINTNKGEYNNPESGQMRLQRFLARAGVASRRKCEALITDGRVRVNGVVAGELGTKVDPARDVVELDGKPVALPRDTFTCMLNKPCGYITTVSDDRGRKTVMDLVPACDHPGLFPVGRLDGDTSGLLLFTTDGKLANALLHPARHVDKTYIARVEGKVIHSELKKLERGIVLDDGPTSPAKCVLLAPDVVQITIHEGRKRQVRRMFGAIGHKVVELKRISIGDLTLGDLPQGAWRELSARDIARAINA